jgi:hypothetical protein
MDYVDVQVVPGTEQFRAVNNDVHVDEKWFYLIMEKGKFLLLPEDELPSHHAQHKNNIQKVMLS